MFKIIFYITIVSIEYLATTTVSIEVVENSWDKANHFIAFLTLYILLSYAYPNLSKTIKFSILMIFALQIEVVQYFIPNREFSLLDIVADAIGISLGYLLSKIKILNIKI